MTMMNTDEYVTSVMKYVLINVKKMMKMLLSVTKSHYFINRLHIRMAVGGGTVVKGRSEAWKLNQ